MLAVALGLLAAFCWGWADVLARFTGQALGARGALFTMMLAGSAGLSAWMGLTGQGWPGVPSWWTVATALLAMLAMLLFYEAMRRGPVSLVSPATGAYPAWAVLIAMGFGIRPPVAALAAMALTLGGVFVVARFAAPAAENAPASNEAGANEPGGAAARRTTVGLAVVASLLFAVTLLAGQQAILRDGATPMLWWGRTTAALVVGAVLLIGGRRRRPPLKATLLALLQGLLDTLGLVFLFAAGSGLAGAMATVASSAFGVVTVVLARLLYGERVAFGQGAGIALVFTGVAALTAFGG